MGVVLLLLFAFLVDGHRYCWAASVEDGAGFSVEFIHRDSARSPFHDPSLSPHERLLAAARRSLARAVGGGAATASSDGSGGGGVVSEIVSRSFEYLMSVNLGTPSRQLLAIADTGSDLIWVSCRNDSTGTGGGAKKTAAADGPPHDAFDQSQSSTYAVVGCQSDACQHLNRASCDADSHCQYQYSYGDGSRTVGFLSTETFTFRSAAAGGGGATTGVPNVSFGCSTFSAGTFRADGLVGLGGGPLSLVSQLGADMSFGRKFSYCLVPYGSSSSSPNGNDASSALNIGGAKAVVSDPGAASTPLVASDVPAYYTVELESVAVGGGGGQTLATKTARIIVDSGTTLTFLDPVLLQPLVSELERRINLTRAQSPERLFQLCYDVHGREDNSESWGIPDVTLRFGGGAKVTLKPVNTFVLVQEGTLCLALVPVSEGQPISILGNVAQQDFHVGYDLDARTVTFAAADCASKSPASY